MEIENEEILEALQTLMDYMLANQYDVVYGLTAVNVDRALYDCRKALNSERLRDKEAYKS